MRLCSEDARFCIAEVKVGLAADVGTLQRMPKVRACVRACLRLGFSLGVCGFYARKPTRRQQLVVEENDLEQEYVRVSFLVPCARPLTLFSLH